MLAAVATSLESLAVALVLDHGVVAEGPGAAVVVVVVDVAVAGLAVEAVEEAVGVRATNTPAAPATPLILLIPPDWPEDLPPSPGDPGGPQPGGPGSGPCAGSSSRCCSFRSFGTPNISVHCNCGPCKDDIPCQKFCADHAAATGSSAGGCSRQTECNECTTCDLVGFSGTADLYKCVPRTAHLATAVTRAPLSAETAKTVSRILPADPGRSRPM